MKDTRWQDTLDGIDHAIATGRHSENRIMLAEAIDGQHQFSIYCENCKSHFSVTTEFKKIAGVILRSSFIKLPCADDSEF